MKDVEPYRADLQIKHHCCMCGKELPADTYAIRAVVPLKVGNLLTTQAIAWCNGCWKDKVPFSQL